MSSFILALILLIELFFVLKYFKLEMSSPIFLFCCGFVISSIMLFTMKNVWDTAISAETIILISLGCVFFTCGSCTYTMIMQKRRGYLCKLNNDNNFVMEVNKLDKLTSNKNVIYIFLLFNVISTVLYIYNKLNVASSYGASGSLLYLMAYVSDLEKIHAVSININSIVTLCFAVCRYSGYIWGILFVDVFFVCNRLNKLLLSCFFVSLFAWFMTGSRGDGISMLLGVFIYALLKNNQVKKYKLKLKTVLLGIALLVASVFLFDYYARVTNRVEDDYGLWEYIAIYTGAPLLNLDYLLNDNIVHSTVLGEKTFKGVYEWIRIRFGISLLPVATLDSKASAYRSYKGHTLGNVYTIYNSLMRDFYWFGTLVFVFLLGFVCQYFYEESKKISHDKLISLGRLMYVYSAPTLFFSFFSNKFCDTIFNIDFSHGFLAWFLIIFICKKIRIVLGYGGKGRK